MASSKATIRKLNIRNSIEQISEQKKKQQSATKLKKSAKKVREKYPEISNDARMTVMQDEAHRSQYSDFSDNMRDALPNAAFIGFTGTPLIGVMNAKRHAKKFGDYIGPLQLWPCYRR